MANPNTRDIDRDATTTDANDDPTQAREHNKAGHRKPTSRNEPRRTPQSRHDRESHVGGGNQIQSRRGGGA